MFIGRSIGIERNCGIHNLRLRNNSISCWTRASHYGVQVDMILLYTRSRSRYGQLVLIRGRLTVASTSRHVLNHKKKCTAVLVSTQCFKPTRERTTAMIFLSQRNRINSGQLGRFSSYQKSLNILSSLQISPIKNQNHEVLSCLNRCPRRSLLSGIGC